MFCRFDARLYRLEQQALRSDAAHGSGLSSLLMVSRSKEDTVPLASLLDAELDAKITALAGTRGLSLLFRGPAKGVHPAPGCPGQGAPSMSQALAHRVPWWAQQAYAHHTPLGLPIGMTAWCMPDKFPWFEKPLGCFVNEG